MKTPEEIIGLIPSMETDLAYIDAEITKLDAAIERLVGTVPGSALAETREMMDALKEKRELFANRLALAKTMAGSR